MVKKKIKINFFRNTDKSSDNGAPDKAQLSSLNVDEHTLFQRDFLSYNVIFLMSNISMNIILHSIATSLLKISVCFSQGHPTRI